MDSFDIVVIGSGPGGYVCAFRAAQLGLKVALVEKSATLGGTCLNVGCIPSKALLHSTEQVVFARDHAAAHGIKLGPIEVDVATLMKRKEGVVTKLVGGVAQLAKGRKIAVYTGVGSFTSATALDVTAADGKKTQLRAKNFVIATGSAVVELPFLKFDGRRSSRATRASPSRLCRRSSSWSAAAPSASSSARSGPASAATSRSSSSCPRLSPSTTTTLSAPSPRSW